ncbi:DUF6512 family protein [Microbacterium sp. CFH 31415]|uniref:DUF6512 family protein n=1 Tax=Microbacterium sp. CFH 31415 TaxID=2921732 RepID=UPI001F146B90|nr:DUF6512 family protein [Microbacterium sp. CFH 31415]MCH6231243.1 DUF6512 family protein [Microbacterium sp. CFH 31415]
MIENDLLWLNLVAIVPITIIGSLLHFAYDWSRHNRVVAVFAAVNESYWEDIKIAYWPVLVWFAVQFALGGWTVPGFVPAATIALYAIPVTMIAVVFGYKQLIRRNLLWIDILAFFLTVAVSLAVFALIATELAASGWTIGLSGLFLLVLGVAFTRYTLSPPEEPDVFVDPLNKRYGLHAHPDN